MIKKQVLFNPFPKQLEFLEAIFSGKFSFILYGGAIRGGKTFAGLGALLLLCKMYPGSRWAVVREDLQQIKKTVYPSWNKIKPEKFIKSHNMDTHTVTCTNGSQIIFMGENYDRDKELEQFKGLEVNGFLLEEISGHTEIMLTKAFERSGSYIIPEGKQPPPIVIGTCNPTRSWVKEKVYDRWKAGTLPDGWLYIQSRIFDNPYIPEDYKKSLKDNLPRYQYEVFVEGNWDIQLKTGGEFWKSFELEDHVRPTRYKPAPLHISVDQNVVPYITMTIWQGEGKEVRQIDEILNKHPKNTTKDLAKSFIEWTRKVNHNDVVYLYGDRTSLKEDTNLKKGENFFTIIRDVIAVHFKVIIRLPSVNPSVSMSAAFINACYEYNFDGISITIGENCKTSISDYIEVKEDSDGTMKKIREKDPKTGVTFERWGHCSDTKRYFLTQYFVESYRKFQRHPISPEPIIVGRRLRARK
jgi:hypothetical protein